MAKNVYTVTSVDAVSTPTECKVSCYYSMTDAQAAFKNCVRMFMSVKLAFAYSGVHPKPGYKHEITNQFYKFYDGSTIRPLVEVYFGQSELYSASSSTSSAASSASGPAGIPGLAGTPGVVSAPSGSIPVAKPKSAGKPVSTGKVKVNVPGVGDVELDSSALGSAVAAALSAGAGSMLASAPVSECSDDEEE